MTETAKKYSEFAEGFAKSIAAISGDQWNSLSPCDGWTVRDIVDHVMSTQQDFLAKNSIATAEETSSSTDPAVRWAKHSSQVAEIFADPAIANKVYESYFGTTTLGETLLRFYGFDMVAHRWDIATAVGYKHQFTDDELTFLNDAADGFGPALYSDGVCKPGVEAPANSDRQTQVLARLGRIS